MFFTRRAISVVNSRSLHATYMSLNIDCILTGPHVGDVQTGNEVCKICWTYLKTRFTLTHSLKYTFSSRRCCNGVFSLCSSVEYYSGTLQSILVTRGCLVYTIDMYSYILYSSLVVVW